VYEDLLAVCDCVPGVECNCYRFLQCVAGPALCRAPGPTLCDAVPPFCGSPDLTVGFTAGCYEGCVLREECAP
jgi:hypothetical protein